MANMLQLSYSATDDTLTQSDYAPVNYATFQPFLRMTHTDTMATGALFSLVAQQGWKIITIMYSRSDLHAVNQANMLNNMFSRMYICLCEMYYIIYIYKY
jgi:hypothetical protein